MSIDLAGLLAALNAAIGKSELTDGEIGDMFRNTMAALVHFDYVVVFAYRGKERPIDLYSTFNPEEHEVYVTLYQAGAYLLDPFYHTARERREGVFRMRELAPDRFFSSEYYRTYYAQTKLAEEIGFFVNADAEVTVVLSLMRREGTGVFPASQLATLKKAEPLVANIVRHYWTGLASRFSAQLATDVRKRGKRGRRGSTPSTETVWQDLNLTHREASIIELVLQGHSSESIGLRLGISTGTVKVHRRNVYRKLGISSQTQLLSLYLKSVQ